MSETDLHPVDFTDMSDEEAAARFAEGRRKPFEDGWKQAEQDEGGHTIPVDAADNPAESVEVRIDGVPAEPPEVSKYMDSIAIGAERMHDQ